MFGLQSIVIIKYVHVDMNIHEALQLWMMFDIEKIDIS